jgi:hypothetical protein
MMIFQPRQWYQSRGKVSGGDNRIFAENLLSLAETGPENPNAPQGGSAHSLLETIERNYYDFTKTVLSRKEDDWWSLVPERIREACATKKQTEPASQFPHSAYLDLIDFKNIWRVHWELFQPGLSLIGCEGGKNKALKYFQKLNDIRKFLAHSVKLHAAGIELSDEDFKFLETQAQRSVVLWASCNKPTFV